MKPGTRGFSLVEFVIAIVFVGVVLGPLLIFAARLQDLNHAIGQQARREAWRSFTDQAVGAGINPAAAGLTAARNAATPAVPAATVTEAEVPPLAGVATLVPLRVVQDASAAEARLLGGGFQIGAGVPLPARTTPLAPLAPIVMPAPQVVPADGTVLAAAALTPAPGGAPATTTVRVSSVSGSRVHAVFNQPAASVEGAARAEFTVSAVDLLQRVNGGAWTEFAGDPGVGHRAVTLGDGRTRWLVTTAERRLQIYEPSQIVTFAYQLGLGAPVLVRDAAEIPAGAAVSFDYAAYAAVQSGSTAPHIDFASTTKAAFGAAWPTDAIGFQWTFNQSPGGFSGDLAPFFRPESLSLWTDTFTISAAPVVPRGAMADSANWTVVRRTTALGVPVVSTTADASGFFTPGQVTFSAPASANGQPLGRLSFESGAAVSTGSTLSLPLTP